MLSDEIVKITEFVMRPGFGSMGREIRVRANYFEITSLPRINIHHYDIIIKPEVPPSLNRSVFFEFVLQQRDVLGGVSPVFDGRRNVYAVHPLPFGNAATFSVALPGDSGVQRLFQIIIRKVAVIDFRDLHKCLNKRSPISTNDLSG